MNPFSELELDIAFRSGKVAFYNKTQCTFTFPRLRRQFERGVVAARNEHQQARTEINKKIKRERQRNKIIISMTHLATVTGEDEISVRQLADELYPNAIKTSKNGKVYNCAMGAMKKAISNHADVIDSNNDHCKLNYNAVDRIVE